MEIILVGCGKVGAALANKLSGEGHSVTIIDTNAEKVSRLSEELDIMGIVGNGSSIRVLDEAGIENADVFIAVTGSDELNLLCCMFAKRSGKCRTVARVRNPMYNREMDSVKQQLGIAMIINPELASAREISRLLRFPAANKIDTFAGGRVQLIKFEVNGTRVLSGMLLKDVQQRLGADVLICAVERGHDVTIPDGNFMLKDGDMVTMLATPEEAKKFFGVLNMPTRPVRSVLIVGGGTIGYYLAKDLTAHGIHTRILDNNAKRCEELAELLTDAMILHGDGTDRQLLLAEGLPLTEAFVTLTNIDEENVLMALFSKKHSSAKLITKINRLEFDDIIDGLDIGSVIYPKYITCDFIVQYIRSLQNESGSNIKTFYSILDDRVEALEFTVHKESAATKVTLSELRLKPNTLICCITRNDKVIIPRGNDRIQVGDSVIVVTLEHGLNDVRDIVLL